LIEFGSRVERISGDSSNRGCAGCSEKFLAMFARTTWLRKATGLQHTRIKMRAVKVGVDGWESFETKHAQPRSRKISRMRSLLRQLRRGGCCTRFEPSRSVGGATRAVAESENSVHIWPRRTHTCSAISDFRNALQQRGRQDFELMAGRDVYELDAILSADSSKLLRLVSSFREEQQSFGWRCHW